MGSLWLVVQNKKEKGGGLVVQVFDFKTKPVSLNYGQQKVQSFHTEGDRGGRERGNETNTLVRTCTQTQTDTDRHRQTQADTHT